MAKWFYYNESGEKVEVTGGQLKGLAKAGMITPDTIVETEEGKSSPARRVKGLTFAETIQPESQSKNPFTADEQAEIDEFCSKHGADIHKIGDNGNTLLHLAAGNASLAVIKYLILHGADVNVKNQWEGTATLFAANNPNVDVIKFLVAQGGDTNIKNRSGSTPMHGAATNPNVDVAKFLVLQGVGVDTRDDDGATPLHRAVARHRSRTEGGTEVATFLIDRGADVNARDNKGNTPLHEVVNWSEENVEFVKFLVSKGADGKVENGKGKTPIDEVRLKNIVIFRYLCEHFGVDANPVKTFFDTMNTAVQGMNDDLENLHRMQADSRRLAEGLSGISVATHDVAESLKENSFELHEAVKKNDLLRIAMLTTGGANINVKDEEGFTPLHYTFWNVPVAEADTRLQAFFLLIKAGADVNAKDRNGNSILQSAIAKRKGENCSCSCRFGSQCRRGRPTTCRTSRRAHEYSRTRCSTQYCFTCYA